MPTPEQAASAAATPAAKGVHFELIKSKLPDHLINASPAQRQALKASPAILPDWYENATQAQKDTLARYTKELAEAKNDRDRLFARLKSAEQFARELLTPELKKLDSNLDPDSSWLRLYCPRTLGIFGIKTGAFQVKTFSLLQAALHNFEEDETADDFYGEASRFITRPDARGHFERLPTTVGIGEFTRLCRRLDIGQQYQAYLEAFLRPKDAFANAVVRQRISRQQKSALACAAYIALLKNDIGQSDFDLMTRVVQGEQTIMLGEKQLYFRALTVMGKRMNECILFMPMQRNRYHKGFLIAYIPDDPEHPLKRYESWEEFRAQLTRQLQTPPWPHPADELTAYQRFFSRFVPQRHLTYFISRFTNRLIDGPPESFVTTWRRHEWVRILEELTIGQLPRPSDVGNTLEAQDDPNFNISSSIIKIDWFWESYDLWQHGCDATLDRLFDDARVIAVPNADEDQKSRATRFANYLNIGMVALGVFATFVPVLGEVMMVAMVGQLLYETLEGAIELSEGDRQAGWAHITDVLENVATAVALAPVFHYTVSPFIENLKAVKLPGGSTRLWKPDPAPYQYRGALPAQIEPDATGVYQHFDDKVIKLADRAFAINEDPATGQRRVMHPARPEAYQPQLLHNGSGIHLFEGEQPLDWDDKTLLRRLGPASDGLTDTQLQQARRLSNTSYGQLRRTYVEQTHIPPLLDDQLSRLRVDNKLQRLTQQLSSNDPALHMKADAVAQLDLLTRYRVWPDQVSMRIIDRQGRTLWEHTGEKAPPGRKLVVQLHEHEISSKDLLPTVIETLDHQQTPLQIDGAALNGALSLPEKVQTLRQHLARIAGRHREEIFNNHLDSASGSLTTEGALIRSHVPDIPKPVVNRILANVSETERRAMVDDSRLPLRVKSQARDMQFEARAGHAREGLYRPSMMTADSEKLMLKTLDADGDVLADLRIEVREQSISGTLRACAGPADADTVRILVRDDAGQYRLHDRDAAAPRSVADFYEGLLRALPDYQRKKLGYKVSDSEKLRQWLLRKTQSPALRRELLVEPPFRKTADRETLLLLRGPGLSKSPRTVEQHIKELYPHMSDGEIDAYADSLASRGDALALIQQEKLSLQALRTLLDNFRDSQLEDVGRQPLDINTDLYEYQHGGGRFIVDRLHECFQRKSQAFKAHAVTLEGGYTLDLSSDLLPLKLERWWKELPDLKQWTDQITTLILDRGLIGKADKILEDLPQLRHLSARGCYLTKLPDSIGKMHLLETLRLTDNHIAMTPEATGQLKNLTRLEDISLDLNPLGTPPDVSRMPRLKELNVANTGIKRWPVGLFEKKRPKGFKLNLLDNPIDELPEQPAGSDNAFLIARTRLRMEKLPQKLQVKWQNYRRSVGMPPLQTPYPAISGLMHNWEITHESFWGLRNAPNHSFFREAWHDLEAETGSEGFFQILGRLMETHDYRAGGLARDQLSARVWRMVEAMSLDTSLRERLFVEAAAPATCGDNVAQLFNRMGIEVMLAEARAFSTAAQPLERALVTLAKGASRLAQLNEIARGDVRSRTNNPDVVEVYLAYQTGLADRLNLPWQSRGMLHSLVAGVTDQMLENARISIEAGEAGDGLYNKMLEQEFWSTYLKDTWPSRFADNHQVFEQRSELLQDLQQNQAEWVQATGSRKQQLEGELQQAAATLSIDTTLLFTDHVMSDATYEKLLKGLQYQSNQLARNLTREALQRASL
ncbi:NEL-type E3 ubiquitin ligase domain-containing protein [Pseudomonas sp.]|uniref:NEL-type E3 ubiquitin ligase domain-containing protein n=1 Tax=Pseudomonas sp. TaxID=306 RepID=UPI002E3691AA|nr:NEL-type E3 ubiquitin ligase domain-containing protein [Pseudomonas sp.]HEX4551836.1 NEL-type E3 ubiquitin ligase domain-containing protein [Pseudomonas sp.]